MKSSIKDKVEGTGHESEGYRQGGGREIKR